MQRYRYDGFGSDGLKARGEVDANSIADARRLLGLRGIRLISVAPGGRPSRRLLRGLRFHSVRLNPDKLFRELNILTNAD